MENSEEIHSPREASKGDDLWECKFCSFENTLLLSACEMCENKRPFSPSKIQQSQPTKEKCGSGFTCHSCGNVSKKLQKTCSKCNEVIIPSDSEEEMPVEKPPAEKKALAACPSCSFENDPDNTICVSCESSMSGFGLFPSKARSFRPPLRKGKSNLLYCRYCNAGLDKRHHANHERTCRSKGMNIDDYKYVVRTSCSFCYSKIDHGEVEEHDKVCEKRTEFFSAESPTYERVTRLQRDTMVYMHQKSEKLHWINEEALVARIKGLGLKESDLENLHHYIVNYAPIIIHMHVNTHMKFFVKDTHYRNQFETRMSSGSLSECSRTNWEDRMFDRKHSAATPFERVKYGTINFTNDPHGVRCCSGYGQSYFLLKSHVRNRCTVTDMDSSSSTAAIGTFQFCYHILNKLSDQELRAAFDGSKGNEIVSSMIGTYKEIQIHGPVEFKRDIERVYLSKGELTDPSFLQMAKEFCTNNDLEYEIFDYDLAKPSIFGGGGLFGGGGSAAYDKKSVMSEPRLIEPGKDVEIKPPEPLPVPAYSRIPCARSPFSMKVLPKSYKKVPKPVRKPRRAAKKKSIFVPVAEEEESESEEEEVPIIDDEREYRDDDYFPREGEDFI